MKKVPVYGFENNYEINEFGDLYFKNTNNVKKISPNASCKIDRYRLVDKKYYDKKYLVFKSFNRELDIEVNDNRIIFINGDSRDCRLENLKLSNNTREDISKLLSEKYKEQVKPLEGFKNIYISSSGVIYSYYHKSKILKPYVGTDGYLQVKASNDVGQICHIKIHRAVALTFLENLEPDVLLVVHHKDNNKLNNSVSNLEWVTSAQNNIYERGIICCMVDDNNSILSIHETISDLSNYYNVDSSTASKQCRGIKNKFNKGIRARLYDKEHNCFVPTKFD